MMTPDKSQSASKSLPDGWDGVQIKLFPEEKVAVEAEVAIQRGRAGLIRFAATATSYPIVNRVLTELVPGDDDPPSTGPARC